MEWLTAMIGENIQSKLIMKPSAFFDILANFSARSLMYVFHVVIYRIWIKTVDRSSKMEGGGD